MLASIFLYLDPGSGSYIIQVIIAAIFGAWFWFKGYWYKVKSYFTKSKPPAAKEEQQPDAGD
jgi:hypothetical protein